MSRAYLCMFLTLLGILSATEAKASGRAYFANRFDNSVAVVDTSADTLLDTIGVSAISVNFVALAVDAEGRFIYVTNRDVDSLTIVSTVTSGVVAIVPVCDDPIAVAVHPDSKKAYVSCVTGMVNIVDPLMHSVIGVIPVSSPWGLAVHPDGSRLYVASTASPGSLEVFDTASSSHVASISLGGGPDGVAVSPDGSTVYVTTREDDSLSVISTATHAVIDKIAVGNTPRGVTVSPSAHRVYVASQFGDLAVIDTVTNKVIDTVPVSSFGVGVESEGAKIYVPNDDGVAIVDAKTNKVIDTLAVGGGPFAFGIFVAPVGPGILADGFESGDFSMWISSIP